MPPALDRDAQLVVDFCNTLDVDEQTDALDSPADYRRWLADHDLGDRRSEPTPGDLDTARRLRTSLRAAAARDAVPQLDVAADIRIASDGSIELTGRDPVGAVAAAAARLSIEGRFTRVKICPADDCQWVFYDRSRNASGRWCSMQVCGNRAKVRASRARARQT